MFSFYEEEKETQTYLGEQGLNTSLFYSTAYDSSFAPSCLHPAIQSTIQTSCFALHKWLLLKNLSSSLLEANSLVIVTTPDGVIC